MKKTLVLGASTNPERVAYQAVYSLKNKGHEVILVGIRSGEVAGEPIHTDRQNYKDIDTITLYIGPKNQVEWYEYILQLKPNRVIFNPGTENFELINLLEKEGINYELACTLVLLSYNAY